MTVFSIRNKKNNTFFPGICGPYNCWKYMKGYPAMKMRDSNILKSSTEVQ